MVFLTTGSFCKSADSLVFSHVDGTLRCATRQLSAEHAEMAI